MNFSLKQEIGLATLLLIIIIVIHYFISVTSDKYWKGLCDSWYCLELIPLGDVISISIAIIGLYFVVKSLDAWKHQDQYQTAKKNIKALFKFSSELVEYIDFLKSIESGKNSICNNLDINFINDIEDVGNTQVFNVYIEKHKQTKANFDTLKEETTNKNINLFQIKFNEIINIIDKVLDKIHDEINNENDNIRQDFLKNHIINKDKFNRLDRKKKIKDIDQKKLDDIINKHDNEINKINIYLNDLQSKLNNYVQ